MDITLGIEKKHLAGVLYFYCEAEKTVVPAQGFTGKAKEVYVTDIASQRCLLIGLGQRSTVTIDSLRLAMVTGIRQAKTLKLVSVAIQLPKVAMPIAELLSAFSDGLVLAAYTFVGLKKNDPEFIPLTAVHFVVPQKPELQIIIERAKIVSAAVWLARDLVNLPSNVVTPSYLEKIAKDIVKLNPKITLKTISFAEAKKMGMGGFCGVAQGSEEPAKMLVLEYKGDPKETLAVVGKGVTFDSGGISIKPSTNMREMKMDMSGAALVLAVFRIIAQLKPKTHVLGIIPAVENLPSGHAYKPGDVLTFLNRRTTEVVSTDAEGRLILADALCLAQKLGAKKIIDFATLTGAVIVALGHTRAGVMSNSQDFVNEYLQAALKSGERHWQLPMDEEYFESLKSDVADSLNNAEDRVAGTIAGGKFLEKFIEKDTAWIHCDIAGTAWMPKVQGYWDKNATGFAIRTMVEFLGI